MATSIPETTTHPALAALFDEDVTRDRLMAAMGESLMEKGFAGTVVADIVKRARVSRRTFYEEFADRGECFIALCDRATEVARTVINQAADVNLAWEEQSKQAVDAYFAFMSVEPLLTRAMLFEVYALGDRGIASHRETHHRFTEQLIELAARARETDDTIRDIAYASAAAVVGAIYQLIQMATEEKPRVSIDEARVAATELVLAMASARR
ncbi:MAG: TetR/AcrR family transcriptional regulator [Solirubrobacterales bacterium]|nr:TetR/AcrR family transcriptional regulator [Solirubrobacterales bacterium]